MVESRVNGKLLGQLRIMNIVHFNVGLLTTVIVMMMFNFLLYMKSYVYLRYKVALWN